MLDQNEIIDDNNKFNLLLNTYEGPIDLLLDLARKQKVDYQKYQFLI